MKLTTLLLFIALVQVSAKSFSQKISINETSVSLEKVLQTIERQTGYVFFYKTQDVKTQLSVHLSGASIEETLDACFKNTTLTYKIAGKTILLQQKEPDLLTKIKVFFARPIHVKGRITDSTGRPISRATVLLLKKNSNVVKTTHDGVIINTGYTTAADGFFDIVAEEGDRIEINYIGYVSYHATVTKDMPFVDVVLQLSSTRLQEVVIQTGYQTLSKERATGSFSKPDMKIFADRSSSMDVISRLEGQIPGYNIIPGAFSGQTNKNAYDGAAPAIASIRGQSSILSSTQPLFVVDGVVVPDFSALNLDNIADITILKDAASAAIYGAQAGNGVIVITTKKGTKNQKLSISYSGFIDFNGKPDIGYMSKYFLSSSQYVDVARQVFNPTAFPYSNYNSFNMFTAAVTNPVGQALYDQNSGVITAGRANTILDSLSRINNNSEIKRDVYRNAYTTNHTLSVSGGTNTYAVFGSIGYANTQTSDLGQNNNSYKVSLNQTFTPNDRFSFSLNAQLADNVSVIANNPSFDGSVLPFLLFKNASGNNTNMPYLSNFSPAIIKQYSALSGIDLGTYQPLTEINYAHNNTNSYAMNLVGNAGVRIWKGLKYMGTFGYGITPTTISYLQDYRSFLYRKGMLNYIVPGSQLTYLIPPNKDFYQQYNNNQVNWTVRNQLAYDYSGRNGRDIVSVQVGQEAKELHQSSLQSSVYGYDPQLLSSVSPNYTAINGGTYTTIGGNPFLIPPFLFQDVDTRYSSYFALGSYTMDHKYSIDLSWRRDHSNLFGSDISAQNKPAYSIGGKWNLINEKFMSKLSWLSTLALRATYGVTGNSPRTGGSSQLDVISAEQFLPFTAIAGPGYDVNNPGDKKLSWEGTRQTNLGIDFGVFNNRLTGSVEYYHKDTRDLIGSAPVNLFTGYTVSTANVGELVNNGINVNLNSVNITSEHFTWRTGFVFAHNTNKLLSYIPPTSNATFYYLTATPQVPGYSLNSMFAYKYAGLSSTGFPQIYLANGTKTSNPSAATGADLVYMGTTTPKFSGGVSNSFRYDRFLLSVNLTYSLGGVMRDLVNQSYYGNIIESSAGLNGNINKDFLNRWQNPGDENTTNIPRYTTQFNSASNYQYYSNADINVVSASYLKMNEATLSYSISPPVLRLLKIQSASLRAQLNNVMLWTKNSKGLDPQLQSYFGGTSMPIGRNTITLGANINF